MGVVTREKRAHAHARARARIGTRTRSCTATRTRLWRAEIPIWPSAIAVPIPTEQLPLGDVICVGDQVDCTVIVPDVCHHRCLWALWIDDPAVYELNPRLCKQGEFADIRRGRKRGDGGELGV